MAKNILGHVFWCKKFSKIEQKVLWSNIVKKKKLNWAPTMHTAFFSLLGNITRGEGETRAYLSSLECTFCGKKWERERILVAKMHSISDSGNCHGWGNILQQVWRGWLTWWCNLSWIVKKVFTEKWHWSKHRWR